MNHTGPPPSSTNTPSPLTFMLQYPSPTFSNIRPLALHTSNISRTRLLETLATPCTRNKHTPRTCNTHTTHPINELLAHYRSPLIVFIDGSYIDPQVPSFPISVQPSMVLVPRYATSAIVVVVNNTAASPSWTTLSTIPLFVRVQLLPASFGITTPTNNSAELLARILVLESIPHHILAIIIYDSAVVHSH